MQYSDIIEPDVIPFSLFQPENACCSCCDARSSEHELAGFLHHGGRLVVCKASSFFADRGHCSRWAVRNLSGQSSTVAVFMMRQCSFSHPPRLAHPCSYGRQTADLRGYFSEQALIKYRMIVEIEWLKALAAAKVIETSALEQDAQRQSSPATQRQSCCTA